mmetsp:Transcript_27293/g.61011  ORF Transcript_27293/g.61011 Transcript_27293/m.61011 type:complete len:310 (-) Transcript_27293:87-1016(-)
MVQGAKFGLVPRGHGVYSFRLTEVLVGGAIPVVLSNGWVLPFSELLEWDAFSVRLDEVAFMADPAQALDSLVRDVSAECVASMRLRARHVAHQYFSSKQGLLRGLSAVLASRALGCGGGPCAWGCAELGPGRNTGQAAARFGRPGRLGGGLGAELCLADDNPPDSRLGRVGGARGSRGAREAEPDSRSQRSEAPWSGAARRDVALGTAEVCLPPHLRSGSLPARVFLEEAKAAANSQGSHGGPGGGGRGAQRQGQGRQGQGRQGGGGGQGGQGGRRWRRQRPKDYQEKPSQVLRPNTRATKIESPGLSA